MVVSEPVKSKVRTSRLFSNAGLLLIVLGAVIMVFIGWVTWYDLTVWGKDLALARAKKWEASAVHAFLINA